MFVTEKSDMDLRIGRQSESYIYTIFFQQ